MDVIITEIKRVLPKTRKLRATWTIETPITKIEAYFKYGPINGCKKYVKENGLTSMVGENVSDTLVQELISFIQEKQK